MKTTPFYRLVCAIVRLLARAVWRAKARGVECIPREGPVIVACNHLSYFDPPMLGIFCPRQVHYMAKAYLFKIPILGPVIRMLGTFPVDPRGSSTGAIKRALEVLQGGGVVGLFPEGTRNKSGTARAQHGVALLASLSGAPVIPAKLTGTDKVATFHAVRVSYGKPMRLPEGRKATRDDLAKFTADIMDAIYRLDDGNP